VAASHGDGAIEPLSARHVRDFFDCGEPALDRFLKSIPFLAFRRGTLHV